MTKLVRGLATVEKCSSVRRATAAIGGALLGGFLAWWEANDAPRLLGRLTIQADPAGRDAVDRTRAAVHDRLAGRIGNAELIWRLRLVLGRLRG